ncbi:putative F-box associated interaction domain-containing protein [Medicago truncatula]|uniref:Putative F-box associated interaction domain-containing protein n=1 Tax=Medicago truncatula TaxID=3880 RepID=A0A396GXQ1_MEDTR|nr:putative F-box associated interaction domain-containing protein [Medicago truncatula]
MKNEPPKSRRRSRHSNPSHSAILPDDLIFEILSWLTVKPLMKLKCDPYYLLIDKDCRHVVGSCNGLVCLLGYSPAEMWFRFWNPATRKISDKLGFFRDDTYGLKYWTFTMGYDNSSDVYKVVALQYCSHLTTRVRVLTFGNNIWRNIQCFPARVLHFSYDNREFGGVHLNCTVNWLAVITDDGNHGKYVIISLDLATETHTQLRPPPSTPNRSVQDVQPGVCFLMDSRKPILLYGK